MTFCVILLYETDAKQKVDKKKTQQHNLLWSAGFDTLFLSLKVKIVFNDITILFLSL